MTASVENKVRRMMVGLGRNHTNLSELELLFDIRHCSLTLQTDERS